MLYVSSRCFLFGDVFGLARYSWYVRAPTRAEVDATVPRVKACFEYVSLAWRSGFPVTMDVFQGSGTCDWLQGQTRLGTHDIRYQAEPGAQ